MSTFIDGLVQAQHHGRKVGVTSVCSAHPTVLEATLRHGAAGDHPVLIEATCNQVNQDGGYTGMRPLDFRTLVERLARSCGLPQSRLELGGDHLGPNPWRGSTAEVAMGKSAEMVRQYVLAGYTKLHLDTSMKCADDASGALAPAAIAERSAQLAEVAESTAADNAMAAPWYVIGTEVPVPGGASSASAGIHVTRFADVAATIELTREAFASEGLVDAWGRVRAVVAQPGVEFSDTDLHEYNSEAAQHLAHYIEAQTTMVYEAHSTDYQTPRALRDLVTDHFAILKVGPALTFAYREGVFALSYIEDELLGAASSRICDVLEAAMLENPAYWKDFYSGDSEHQKRARKFSRSDRSRYYWAQPAVSDAVRKMCRSLDEVRIPLELVSQYLPNQYQRLREGVLPLEAESLLRDKVREVLDVYLIATQE